jgi:hypothetical protein
MHTLAQHLERQRVEGMGGTEIALDQVWTLAGTRRCRAVHGLTFGLTTRLTFWLTFRSPIGLLFGLA